MITALLVATWNRLGGNGEVRFRRWGIPIIILILHPNLMGVLSAISLFIVTSLPITLKGSDIKENLWWIPILGLLYGVTLLPLNTNLWLIAFVSLSYFGLVYLTTIVKIKNGDLWWLFEILFGFIYGLNI